MQVYGPTADNGYGTDVFPALRDAMNSLVKRDTTIKSRPLIRQSINKVKDSTGKGSGTIQRRELEGSPWNAKKRSPPRLGGSNGRQGGWESVQHEIFRVARAVVRVANVLIGTLR